MDRRHFLATVSCTLVGTALPARVVRAVSRETKLCWLDVVAPLALVTDAQGIETELILTSDTFAGVNGHADGKDQTEYEIALYDAAGQLANRGGQPTRLTVPALHTTSLSVRELLGGKANFVGGMKVRLLPRGRAIMHASDLFSAAFARWQSAQTFDNVHANPDPLQWQTTDAFYYSMPFPVLADYRCVFAMFNPNAQRSVGSLTLHNAQGQPLAKQAYELKPHASTFFDLRAAAWIPHPLEPKESKKTPAPLRQHGLLAVQNDAGTAKAFGFMLIEQPERARVSIEHPIHQGVFKPQAVTVPFDAQGQFKAKNILYSPLLLRGKRLGGVTFETRYWLGSGLPLEAAQWCYPFAVNGAGEVAWSSMTDERLARTLPGQTERGVIRLATGQSCLLDTAELSFPREFAGGLALAVAPDTSHTLTKVEVRIPEWNAYAFTHLRPGLRSARGYQRASERGGLATDYIVSGARLMRTGAQMQNDEILGVINIDDQGVTAQPTLEIFGNKGLRKRVSLEELPPFGCKHFLLSQLVAESFGNELLTLRLVDQQATLLLSAIHLDYVRRDLALDHGSDRFSTFLDYHC